MLSKTRAALAMGTLLPLLHACGLEDVNQGHVRVLNATSEYTTLDLYDADSKNDSEVLISGTKAGEVSDYQKLDAGTYTFQVLGASSGAAAATSESTSIGKTDHYVVVASVSGTKTVAKVLSEEEDAPTSGHAKLRIYNAAPTEAGGVDVYLTSHACNALDATDSAFASSIADLQDSFVQINATASGSKWNICVTGAGSTTDLRLTGSATFTDGEVATLVLNRSAGGVLLNGVLLPQQQAQVNIPNTLARVRVVADAAGKAPVSATLGGTPLIPDQTPSPTIGAYTLVDTATTPTAALSIGGVALANPSLSLKAGADYTLLVAGTAAASTVQLIPDNNTPSTSSAQPVKMRLINGLNGLATPASLSSDGTAAASSIAFGGASGYTNVGASANTNSQVDTTSGGVLLSRISQPLTGTTVYSTFLLGDYTGPTDLGGVFVSVNVDRSATGTASSGTGTGTDTGSTGSGGSTTSGN